jgi:hypothetical protein
MSLKTASRIQVSQILASVLVFGLSTFPLWVDQALADEVATAQRAAIENGRPIETSPVQGQLVSVVDAGAATCAATPAPTVDRQALDSSIKIQIVHLARLEAQLQGQAEIVLPEMLQGQENAEPIASALRDEKTALAADTGALETQIAEMLQDKALTDREIEFTKAKDDALGREIALFQARLQDVSDLEKKGLSVRVERLALEQNVVQLENNRLDLKLLVLKAEQAQRKVDRSVEQLHAQYKTAVLTETAKTQAAIAELVGRKRAAQSSVDAASGQSRDADGCKTAGSALYLIAPGADGSLRAFPVASRPIVREDEGDAVSPRSANFGLIAQVQK